MECAHVFKHNGSVGIKEPLIVSAVEAILVDADRIKFPQLEPHATIRATEGTPSYVEELVGPGSCLLPSSLAYPWCETGAFDFQPITVPLRVSVKRRTQAGVMFKP